MRLAIFGATGTVGSAVLERVLAEGHDVCALVRGSADRLTPAPGLSVVVGDALDPAAVRRTIEGADAVLSSLGGFADPEAISRGTATIVEAMRDLGLRRLVVMQGFHLTVPGDPRNVGRVLVLPWLWFASRTLIRESRAMAELLRRSGLDWTLVRAPRVVPGEATGTYRTGHLRLGPWSSVTRGDVAHLMLGALRDPSTTETAPMISGGGR